MTAPLHEETAPGMTLLAELSDMSAIFSPDRSKDNTALESYTAKIESFCSQINHVQNAYILDCLIILIDGLDLLLQIDRNLNESECNILQRIPHILSESLFQSVDSHQEISLIELLKNPDWIRPVTTEEEQEFLQSFDSADDNDQLSEYIDLDDVISTASDHDSIGKNESCDEENGSDSTWDTSQDTHMEDINTSPDIDTNQQELVDLIKVELQEIIDNQYSPDNDLQLGNHELCIALLTNMSDQAENISNALELIGLEGISLCGKIVTENLNSFSNSVEALNKNHAFILKQWPLRFLDYLNNFNSTDTVSDLITLLKSDSWHRPLSDNELDHLNHLLNNPVFLEEDSLERQTLATTDDVDISLPSDVNQDLLDGLLQDLPSQTEEFSTAIQNISTDGGLENLDIAQRVAHTLKGAANVVGVKGIANLTHHLEDILQAQAKAKTKPDQALIDVLIRASDCLESMTETLLGMDTAPEDAVNIFQDVLDWANKLDNNSSLKSDETIETPDSHYESNLQITESEKLPDNSDDVTGKQQTPKKSPIENVLRIPVSLADDMLRLAGENLIYTSQIQENINILARKQDALDLHNQSLLQLSFDLEHLIDIQGFMPGSDADSADGMFDPLEMDEYHEIHTISRRLVEIAADSVELSNELDKDLNGLKELVVNQNQLHKEGEELVLRTRMVPIKTIIPRLKRGVRQICRLTHKSVELIANDNHTFMDSEVLNSLIEPIMHILRNSIDHGIETEEERLSKGKSPTGTVKLNFERKGNQVLIDIFDDGHGLDTDEIHSKAISSGLISADDDLSKENIQKLILEHGFTTRNNITQVSGRGIGLDVVSVKIRELKGSIDISSNIDEGCKISLSLPISSFSTHSLLVRSRQYIYAISSHGIEEIIYPGLGEIRNIGDETIFKLGHEAYSAILLDTLLDLPPDRRKIDRDARPILLVKDESGSKSAILVQDVIDSRDVVVKTMGCYIPKLSGIIGATVLGDGSVSPVIDLPEILHSFKSPHSKTDQETATSTIVSAPGKLPNILVVDDSLSSRRSLEQFVEDMGFSARTARDGMEALTIIESRKPDLLLVDMEMPKMNGLELTSHVRATPESRHIPVIMITSRSTDKHRKAAIDKGVDHYMVKPFNEDELAQHINSLLENT